MKLEQYRKEVANLSINEQKLRDLYLRDLALGKLQGPPTGYASLDKPWLKYQDIEEAQKERPKHTVYQEVYENNKEYLNDIAIEFFGSKISYKKFFENIEKTAKAFEEVDIKKGDFVTICAAGIPETAYCFYALSKIGAVANMISPYFDKNDFIDRVEDCESDIIIIMDQFYNTMKDAIKKSRIKKVIVLPTLNSSLLHIFNKQIKIEKDELFWNDFIKKASKRKTSQTLSYEPDMPLAMVYSSGTTGASKGILLSNDSFQNSIQSYPASGVDISRGQKFYQIIPTWFSTGISTSLHLPLSYGNTVFMDPRFERKAFIKNILKSKPNYAVAPTSMYEGFLDETMVKGKDLSFFNYPFEGGEPLRTEVAEKIEKVFKEHGNDAKLRVAYGQCECGAAITTQTQKIEHSDGSVGIPLPNVTIGIYDTNNQELNYYERGRILVKTPCSMLEYYKNPEETNKYFFIDENGNKWNCTGDIGYIDKNGELFVQGRESDFTIINNKKIYNFDIENLILLHDDVKNCDVLNKNGQTEEIKLVAHIIFTDEFIEKTKNNPELLILKLSEIQHSIYEKTEDDDFVPLCFKVRESFPYAKSGKRDVAGMKRETEGFINLDKMQKHEKEDNITKIKQLKI